MKFLKLSFHRFYKDELGRSLVHFGNVFFEGNLYGMEGLAMWLFNHSDGKLSILDWQIVDSDYFSVTDEVFTIPEKEILSCRVGDLSKYDSTTPN